MAPKLTIESICINHYKTELHIQEIQKMLQLKSGIAELVLDGQTG